MGLLVQQNDSRSELQTRVSAELQEKLRTTPQLDDADKQQQKILEDQHETRPAGIIIGLLIIAAAVLALFVPTR